MSAMSVSQVRGLCFHSGSPVLALAGLAVWAAAGAEACAFTAGPDACAFAVPCFPVDPCVPADPGAVADRLACAVP